jgi:hypothetical protein
MSIQWTLTLVEYNENDMPQDETLATCDSRFHMLQTIMRREAENQDAYKCYVTEWDYSIVDAYDSGEIVEQTNAQEWMEDELKRYDQADVEALLKPKGKTEKKHPVKRIPLGNGEFHTDMYEYRGYTISRNDNVPSGYWGRWELWPGGYTTDTRQNLLDWIDQKVAQKEAKKGIIQ